MAGRKSSPTAEVPSQMDSSSCPKKVILFSPHGLSEDLISMLKFCMHSVYFHSDVESRLLYHRRTDSLFESCRCQMRGLPPMDLWSFSIVILLAVVINYGFVRYSTTGADGPTPNDDASSGTTIAWAKVDDSKAAAFVRPRMVAGTSRRSRLSTIESTQPHMTMKKRSWLPGKYATLSRGVIGLLLSRNTILCLDILCQASDRRSPTSIAIMDIVRELKSAIA